MVEPAREVRALDRPPPVDVALIALAVAAVSTSAPLIRLAAAPAFAISFWRNAMASGVLVPWTLLRARAELRALSQRERRLALLAGALLALHFATWISSLSFTSVASSTALVATQPVWAALVARRRGEHVPRLAWAGITLAILGAVVLTGIDVSIDAATLWGDVLAIVGGMFAALYVVVGADIRRSVSTTVYTTVCYATTAVLLLVLCVVTRTPLSGYSATTWWCLIGLTVGAQLLGHSVFNRVLRTTSPTIVSISILFEIVGAALLAAVFLDERPPLAAIPAAALIVAGLVLVIRAGDRKPAVSGVPAIE